MSLIFTLATSALLAAQPASELKTSHSAWILDHSSVFSDFPKEGFQFLWYSELLKNPQTFQKLIDEFAARYQDMKLEAIVALESRGFILGAPLAYKLGLPLVVVRKAGKLPGPVEKIGYSLEYGSDAFEIEKNSLKPGQRVLIIDDILASGGTVEAASLLVERLGAEVVEVACMVEIGFLKGRERLNRPLFSLIDYSEVHPIAPAPVEPSQHNQ